MKKLIPIVILTLLVFSFGILADEAIKPTDWWWQKIDETRRLGYVEGFNAGILNSMREHFCKDTKLRAVQASGDCILYGLEQKTMLDVGTSNTLDVISKFYALPQNLPVHWDHAVVISKAMVSGVPINEKDLEVIRQEDAKFKE